MLRSYMDLIDGAFVWVMLLAFGFALLLIVANWNNKRVARQKAAALAAKQQADEGHAGEDTVLYHQH